MNLIQSGALFLLSLQAVNASINPNYNHNYCLNQQISIDPNSDTVQVEEETQAVNFYHNDNKSADNTINDVAMFFHGGNQLTQSPSERLQLQQQQQQQELRNKAAATAAFIAMGECAFVSYLQDKMNNWEEDFEDESDDEDDDDNDGHSSMLSNASLSQRVSISGSYYSTTNTNTNYVNESNNEGKKPVAFQRSVPMLSNHRSSKVSSSSSSKSSLNSVLQVRGGASAGPAADEFAKRLIAAATVTVLYEGMIGHILEFLKIAMQTAPIGTSYMSILKSITQEKGIAGAWDGFVPWGIVQSVCKGGVFGLAHAMAKTYLNPLVEKNLLPEQVAQTLAGGIAGGFQGFVLSPTLLLKTRVMTNPVFRENMSLLRTTLLSFKIGLEVAQKEGVLALMKGADIFAMKRVFDWSTRYYFKDVFSTLMLNLGAGANGALSTPEKIVASLLAGTASTLVTLPLDVIVAKSQDAKKAGVKVSAFETFMKDYKEGGMKGLYDANMMGFEARLLHVCFTTVVMQFGSPVMFDLLFGNK